MINHRSLLMLAIVIGLSGSLDAGVITGATPTPDYFTPPSLVDSQPYSYTNNKFRYRSTKRITLRDLNPYDIRISITDRVAPDPEVTSYHVTIFLVNSTGSTWNGMDMTLGWGVGSQFQLAQAPNPVINGQIFAYDPDNTDTWPNFESFIPTQMSDVALHWDTYPILSSTNLRLIFFSMSIPNSGAETPGSYELTMRLTPYVAPIPEPASLALLLVAMPGLLLRRRQRR